MESNGRYNQQLGFLEKIFGWMPAGCLGKKRRTI